MPLFLYEAKRFYLVENAMNTSKCRGEFPRKTGSKILKYGGGNVVHDAKILQTAQRRGSKRFIYFLSSNQAYFIRLVQQIVKFWNHKIV